MLKPFLVVYLAAALLLLIAFWVVGMATESFQFATNCFILSLIGLVSSYLQSQSNSPTAKRIGLILQLAGLVSVLFILGQNWQLAIIAGAVEDLAWIMLIAIVTVMVVYLVGRWWGEFYASISFIVVPVLSIFGLSIPIVASLEVVFSVISAMVVSLFLVSMESLLVRWQKGQLGQVTFKMLFSYCWRLAVTGSATVLTIGLLLVPPATLLQTPLSHQLIRLPNLPFFQFNQNAVEFPDLFTTPGGPINLPDTELFRVKGTTYPRWRVRTYTNYIGTGWRVSSRIESPDLPHVEVKDNFIELSWKPISKLAHEPVQASVSAVWKRFSVFISPGEALSLRISSWTSGIIMRTKSGCLVSTSPIRVDSYTITAQPIRENLPLPNSFELSAEERRLSSYFPPYLYRVQELAVQVTRNAKTPYEKAKTLEAFLRTNYRYSYSPPSIVGRNIDAVTFFLFDAKEGACDWFASALALMCRAVGIPTRVVTGFYSDEVDSDGSLVIRASDAHAWVEAFIEGHGWITLDATPAGERNRFELWRALQQWLSRRYRTSFANPYIVWWFVALLWILAMIPTIWYVSRKTWEEYKPRPRWQVITRCYLTAVQAAQKAGLNLHQNATPWENAEACSQTPRFPVAGKKAFKELADLTVAVLYAGEEPSKSEVKRAKQLLKIFSQQVRLYKRWFAPLRLPQISLQTIKEIWERI
ncbi:MAG: transglutaminase domain-containing protein [Armatimonadetes bacterium]|nr:transglutaminase domain-containing protein [Armatimonadota bacterium]